MRREENMMPTFLSGGEQNAPPTPETPCRGPGHAHYYLTDTWRSSDAMWGGDERMTELLQRWGDERGGVRYLKPPGEGGTTDQVTTRSPSEESLQDGVGVDVTLSDLQDLAVWQQQQISSTRGLLASKEQQLRRLKEEEQQEAKLKRVRALRGRVEQKRLSNNKLVEEIEQMSGLFRQKRQELLVAVARAEELSEQLEALRSRWAEPVTPAPPPRHHASAAELERLHQELQNRAQSSRLQQQWEGLSRRNQEVAAMDRRLAALRRRLREKKAGLQPKESQPVALDGTAQQHGGVSRVAAVGPYIQGPPGPAHPDAPLKAAGTGGTLETDASLKPPPRPAKPAAGVPSNWSSWSGVGGACGHASTLPRMSRVSCWDSGEWGSPPTRVDPPAGHPAEASCPAAGGATPTDQKRLSGSEAPPPVPSRTNRLANNLQASGVSELAPPPLPSKPKPFLSALPTFSSPAYSTGTFPGKMRLGAASSHTLPLRRRQESPPAAAVRPYAPELPDAPPPQTLAAASIYSMYTQQPHLGRGQGTLPRGHARVYGKPVLPASGGQRPLASDGAPARSDGGDADVGSHGNGEGVVADADPRPLSPTKLLPFLSHPHRKPSDHAPRPLKKRSSLTEPEGPAGPRLQKLLYQRTTLAAMETAGPAATGGKNKDPQTPPPLPPRSPAPNPASCPSPPEGGRDEGVCLSEFPPYPPPPYPSGDEEEEPPGVTPPPGQRSILRKAGCGRSDRDRNRVRFNPLALLLDASLEGEFDLVQRVIYDVDDPSTPNDEGITALHNAVCAGHAHIAHFLVQFGVNANAADSDGWTPLHCAASCNSVPLCRLLVDGGAAVFATTLSDQQTPAHKCEETEDGYAQCAQFLHGVQEKMGVMNGGVVYALWDYEPQNPDELPLRGGDRVTVLRRGDTLETLWWWGRRGGHEGYVPRNLLGLYPRVKVQQRSLA
ncbi:apoptosis-stimulating of p53 protein 2-like isoform X2 [Antennarius striatus]|uniref:apoptosis-stimulating of p53 protein 2-like isoform X2 n=1 Tax=Antennarius striatus TaxID=241820 RepID=UPI0035AF8A91